MRGLRLGFVFMAGSCLGDLSVSIRRIGCPVTDVLPG
uniref:Uncharacterized protein n=1 Tax=Anguilla anguilla TaxID=7936 RepID=A0A0E9TYS1_ANGAN